MNVSTVKDYLGDTSWDDDEIGAALAAETAAQAQVCRVPDLTPVDLPIAGQFLDYSGGTVFEPQAGGWTRAVSTDEGFGIAFGYEFERDEFETNPALVLTPYETLTFGFEFSRMGAGLLSGNVESTDLDMDTQVGVTTIVTAQLVATRFDDDTGRWTPASDPTASFYGDESTDYAFRNFRLYRMTGYPADLTEALCRRVAANLANRGLPLGLQAALSEGGAVQARVGGGDREVKRLEAPYRRLGVG